MVDAYESKILPSSTVSRNLNTDGILYVSQESEGHQGAGEEYERVQDRPEEVFEEPVRQMPELDAPPLATMPLHHSHQGRH